MDKEKIPRRIEHKGSWLEISLTDEEFESWSADPDLLDFVFACKEDLDRQDSERKARGPDESRIRRFKYKGRVLEFPCRDSEYFRLATDRRFLDDLGWWSKLPVQERLRML